MYGAKKVGMIASPDIYGQSFIDWFAFQACELGLEVGVIASLPYRLIWSGYIELVQTVLIIIRTDN